jgi:hypothetical protein
MGMVRKQRVSSKNGAVKNPDLWMTPDRCLHVRMVVWGMCGPLPARGAVQTRTRTGRSHPPLGLRRRARTRSRARGMDGDFRELAHRAATPRRGTRERCPHPKLPRPTGPIAGKHLGVPDRRRPPRTASGDGDRALRAPVAHEQEDWLHRDDRRPRCRERARRARPAPMRARPPGLRVLPGHSRPAGSETAHPGVRPPQTQADPTPLRRQSSATASPGGSQLQLLYLHPADRA